MSNKTDNLDEMLECAIREAGAIGHMEELAREERERRRAAYMRFASYVTAACFIVACGIGIDYKLSRDARNVGYGFNPAAGQAGGSEITAQMQARNIDAARELIVAAKSKVEENMKEPVTDDSEYIAQLKSDRDELDLLDAVCLLRKGKYIRAKKALKTIESGGGAFAHEAGKLLKAL